MAKWHTCQKCFGSGYVECDRCLGTGANDVDEACRHCDGEGAFDCDDCECDGGWYQEEDGEE